MSFKISQACEKRIEELISRYPTASAALLPSLWEIQEERGFISDTAIEYIAAKLDLPVADVFGAVTFYTMFNRKQIGKHHIQVCTNICCWLKGSKDVLDYLKARLDIEEGETTENGEFTLSTVECLGACGGAPMMMVDLEYYENLTFEKIDQILESLKKGN
jgi:NADH-quinone oxidoreductase E subunit